jgi:hypothetical protein
MVCAMKLVLGVLLVAATAAHAGCPKDRIAGERDPCRPWNALFLPTVTATSYMPEGDGLGAWYGAGFEAVLLAWSDNSDAFGPSQGKLRFDISALRSPEDGLGTMIMYRGGVQVAVERNAARRFLIPYVTSDLGGISTDALGTRGFVDAGAGVYLFHQRATIVDLEVAYVIPFAGFDELGGLRAQLAVSVALW